MQLFNNEQDPGRDCNITLCQTQFYQPSTHANISGATIVASLSTIYFGVLISSLPQVIFSLGTAPEYEPYDVVESLIWQKKFQKGTSCHSRSWYIMGTT